MLAQSVMLPFSAPAASSRLAGSVDLGVLTKEITPELVDEVIGLSGCREKRQRLLPARAVVYFVLGLCLFSGADSCAPPGYRSVMRWLANGLRQLGGPGLPTSSALSRARQRLGTAQQLEFEQANQDRCHRLRVEDLNADPVQTLKSIGDFLALDDGGAPPSFFHDDDRDRPADLGAGGAGLPTDRIPAPLLARVNELHRALGYPPVTEADA